MHNLSAERYLLVRLLGLSGRARTLRWAGGEEDCRARQIGGTLMALCSPGRQRVGVRGKMRRRARLVRGHGDSRVGGESRWSGEHR